MQRGDDEQRRDGESEEIGLGPLIHDAHAVRVDVDAAARHLWVIHRLGQRRGARRARARQAVLAGIVSLALLSVSGVAVAASGSAVPGDTLYPVKRGVEQVHLMLTLGAADDARLHLEFARLRLEEAVSVAASRPEVLPDLFHETARLVERAEELSGPQVAAEVVAVRTAATETIAGLSGGLDRTVALELEAIAEVLSPTAIAAEDESSSGAEAGEAPTGPAQEAPDPSPEPEPTSEPTSEPTAAPRESAAPAREAPAVQDPAPSASEGGTAAAEDPDEQPARSRKPSIGELGDMVTERSTASGQRSGGAGGGDEAGDADGGTAEDA